MRRARVGGGRGLGTASLLVAVACSSHASHESATLEAGAEERAHDAGIDARRQDAAVDGALRLEAEVDAALRRDADDKVDASGSAAAAFPSRAELDAWIGPVVDQGYIHGMVVGLVDATHSAIYGYGTVGATGAAPTETTIYQIGSLTETFTGLAAAAHITSGGLQGDEAVQGLFPTSVTVPGFGGAPIRVVDLATHSSGLPRSPTNQTIPDPWNPYATYTVADLYAFVTSDELTYAPGTQYLESDVGMGLLGLGLALHDTDTYSGMIQATVSDPLGLVDTTGTLTQSQESRAAPGYDGDFNSVGAWTFTDAMAGSGALSSTAKDLLQVAAAEAGIMTTPLATAMTLTQQATLPIDQEGDRMGFNWVVSPANLTWSEGALYGSMSFVGIDVVHQKAVVLLLDTGAYATVTPLGQDLPGAIGTHLVRWLQGTAPPAITTLLPPSVALSTAQLQPFVGTYGSFPDSLGPVTIALQVDVLVATASWLYGNPFKLYPTSQATFAFRAVNGNAAFQMGEGVTGVSITAYGQTFQGRKM